MASVMTVQASHYMHSHIDYVIHVGQHAVHLLQTLLDGPQYLLLPVLVADPALAVP